MLSRILADLIAREGPISFREFQQTALYDPVHGYYLRHRDPFGVRGDFYTAEQLQPVFGMLIERIIAQLAARMDPPTPFQVVELGAGRAEMRPYLQSWNYTPVDSGYGELPQQLRGVIFANEFLDALPVHLVRKRGAEFVEVRVGHREETFDFIETVNATGDIRSYLKRHASDVQDGWLVEVHLDALLWLDRISKCLIEGWVLFIDYGFNERERLRFPNGTLMSYWRHQATDDVLTDPGERDITTHVPFTTLIEEAQARGFQVEQFESLSQLLLRAGDSDHFAAILDADTEDARNARRQQLKTLLYSMGDTFRALLLHRSSKLK